MQHSAVGLPSGSIATLGGLDPNKGVLKEIWVLNESKWTKMGELLQVRNFQNKFHKIQIKNVYTFSLITLAQRFY